MASYMGGTQNHRTALECCEVAPQIDRDRMAGAGRYTSSVKPSPQAVGLNTCSLTTVLFGKIVDYLRQMDSLHRSLNLWCKLNIPVS